MRDDLVAAYLDAVRRATADLPADRREELLADLREHIATARAELEPETEAGVRTILERLGDPAGIAAEARLGVPRPIPPATVPPPGRGPGRVILLVVAGLVALVLLVCGLGAAFFVAGDVTPARSTPVPVPSPAGTR